MAATTVYSGNFDEQACETLVWALASALRDGESFDFVSDKDPNSMITKLIPNQLGKIYFETKKGSAQAWNTRIYKAAVKINNHGCCGGGCGG